MHGCVCVKSAGRSTGREVNDEARGGRNVSVDHSCVFTADRSTKGAHNDVSHPRRPGLTGLTTTIADPSTTSSEATTSGSRAGDPFNRREQGTSGLVHRGARMLVRNVSHEARNGS